MKKINILVVEDDVSVRNLIVTTLKLHEYKYEIAQTGKEALMIVSSQSPDVILLDLGLPDIDGCEVISTIRSWSNVPIIVVSARTEDNDKIEALDRGADDYLTKPFSVDELLARIRVVIRRLNTVDTSGSSLYQNGNLCVDFIAGTVTMCNEEIHLTPIEYKLLCVLCKNTGKVLTHKYILKEVWGTALENDIASLRVFMATLRKKLEEKDPTTKYIQTHVGVGYRMIKH
ncbi:response regulator transcription factor [Floccifex sp.]|uniref:response regulator transcription factor n=1 Tax=Floccifex sp. TaxID=2815810 RepID=UPI002A756957|nr:response regulator transcription factor [Floccifex sp.]MDD7281559.1 response regulator transcription factor [Erysipelotrichaceae bacterium]MDY2958463.1 response regulator transcription factor [Floccifex sp.]